MVKTVESTDRLKELEELVELYSSQAHGRSQYKAHKGSQAHERSQYKAHKSSQAHERSIFLDSSGSSGSSYETHEISVMRFQKRIEKVYKCGHNHIELISS